MPRRATLSRPFAVATVLLLAGLVLGGAARLRGAEYDEQYSRFLLAGDARPVWPEGAFTAGAARHRFAGAASPVRIATDLRRWDVHPPLYFWLAALWRSIAGDTLWRLRLLSVACGLAALGTVGLIARRTGIPPALAMLLTLGCYAFAYTATVARGFALAELLALLGVLAALRADRATDGAPAGAAAGTAGLLLGAACFTNYLAAFLAAPVVLWLAARRLSQGALAAGAALPFAAADLWFLAAQHGSRSGQFPPFRLGEGLARLAGYGAASLAGGLPLYVPAGLYRAAALGCAALLAGATLLVAARFRRIATPRSRALLLGLVAGPPAGLLLLGAAFDSTPIELRYLSFGTPYAALLLAGALASLPRRTALVCGATALAMQAAALAGLLLRPETMQPMQAAAAEASALADSRTVVLLPRGNDGVGIVGAFVTEAPDALRLALVDAATDAAALRGMAPRVALARLDRDDASRATVARIGDLLAHDPCWRSLPGSFRIAVYENECEPEPWPSKTATR